MSISAPLSKVLSPYRQFWIVVALFGVYVIWGSTYFAIRIGLESFPPFAMAALRFILAGALLFIGLWLSGTPLPTRLQWRNSAVMGVFLLMLGNGLVCYAEQTVSSGLAAVAVASMPLFSALFARWFGHQFSKQEVVALIIGFAGIIGLNSGAEFQASPKGAIALIIAPMAWAFGGVWSRRQDLPSPWMNTALQMLCGGVVLLIVSLCLGEQMALAQISLNSWLAMLYLIVFGSFAGFTAYIYLLGEVRLSLATSYAYVNPPIALFIGYLFGHENFSFTEICASVVILISVLLIILAKRK